MLFKRVLAGGEPLKKAVRGVPPPSHKACAPDAAPAAPPCEHCDHLRIVEEVMRVVVLTLVLWAGITYGGVVMPYSINFITTGAMFPPPTYDYPFPSSAILKKLPAIKDKHFNESLRFAQMSIDALKRLEKNLEGSRIHAELGSPEHGQLIVGYPSDDANTLQRLSWTVTKASAYLSHAHCERFGIPDEECASYIGTFSLQNTDIGKKCTSFQQPLCSISKKYRTYDGSCNNLKRGAWGQALTGLKRLFHPKYADGIDEPRVSISNKALPMARLISSSMAADINIPDTKHSLALMQWTQFLEHDLVHVPVRKMVHSSNSIACCDRSGRMLAPRYQHPSCLPLSVSRKDPFYGSHWVSCLTYTRSVTTLRSDCTFGAAEQMNQASHFLDGSQIYGSSIKAAKSLRDKSGGLMKVEESSQGVFLPLIDRSERREKCQLDSDDDTCFKSGDVRANIHPHLTAMHTLWMREHNRIARALADLNPTWGDEMLYQESRRIVVAQLQHITYTQWLPELVGTAFDERIKPYDVGYSPDVDPSVTNSLATAGLRFYNSLLDGTIHFVEEDGTVNGTDELADHFNRPAIVLNKFDQLVRGMVSQRSQSMDLHFVDDIIQQLYSSKGKRIGLDILSMDIQRGRDHGIPAYYQFREECKLNPVKDFDDFADAIPDKTIVQLRRLYVHAHDVDLIVGALAEQPRNGTFLGPTFSCLLREQMRRTRSGDRYFYTNIEQPEPFTQQQLEQIKKSSLARIICDNVPEIMTLPRNVFKMADLSNEYVSCEGNAIKRMNLAAWQDPRHKPDILTRTKRNVGKWMKHNT
ncbi:salivary peroxidase/catechol oxidase-like [Arctopsyche grandis]|uniref:salivary peroxidase/catechol oxidase-like n=1 Tax=Arctopsyche grandis TaxID=121162 RepID=UPI00406D8CE5